MAWEARLGLKLRLIHLNTVCKRGLNGLGSPSGIETVLYRLYEHVRNGLNGLGSPSGIETEMGGIDLPGPQHWLNGLGSPSGIETLQAVNHSLALLLAKWPGKPVWD